MYACGRTHKGAHGSVAVQFCGCDGMDLNCLPIAKGWNYTVRLYRPRAESQISHLATSVAPSNIALEWWVTLNW